MPGVCKDFPNLLENVMASPGSLAQKMGITRGEKIPIEEIYASNQFFHWEKMTFKQLNDFTHTSSFYSYQHHQNVDRHNTDNFPVYIVLIASLQYNKISLWYKIWSSIYCIYISYYKC